MQINLPSSLRVIRNAKILKNLLDERGINFPLARCRDIVSQMLGFEGYNHLLQRMKPSGPAFWDEDQPRGVAAKRFGQYVAALMEADETNDDLYVVAHFFWLICFPRRLEAVIRSRKRQNAVHLS